MKTFRELFEGNMLKRPDGRFVLDNPIKGTKAYKRNWKIGDRVHGQYHDISKTFLRIKGVIVGFVENDIVIETPMDDNVYFIDAKNVFRLKMKTFRELFEENQKIISFDFDDTIGLTKWDVENNDYVRDQNGDLIQTPNYRIIEKIANYQQQGYKTIIVTSRYEKWKDDIIRKLSAWSVPIIPDDIYCTNFKHKVNTLKRLGAIKHYDDDMDELRHLRNTKIQGILVKDNENI